MGDPLPSLTKQEYEAIRNVLATIDDAARDGVDIDSVLARLGMKDEADSIAVMRAYAEGYEAEHGLG